MSASDLTKTLTHRECLKLISGARPVRVGTVSVSGRTPVRVAFFPLPDGDVVIPTGIDRDLESLAAGRSVTVQFEQNEGAVRWLIRGAGKARPLRRRDRPPAAATGALATSYAFENGIRVAVEDLVGEQAPEQQATTG